MPRADYKCDTCAEELVDHYKAVADPRPHCPRDPSHGEMEWIPAFGGRRGFFKSFDLDLDGKVHHVSTLGEVRAIEREAERRYRNGEGSPTVFREFANNPSNYDKNVFGESPAQGPPARLNQRGRPFITRGDHPAGSDDR
jgi:hypothetical protein